MNQAKQSGLGHGQPPRHMPLPSTACQYSRHPDLGCSAAVANRFAIVLIGLFDAPSSIHQRLCLWITGLPTDDRALLLHNRIIAGDEMALR